MTWGRAWGDAWGHSFGDGVAGPVVITGAGSAHQPASTVSGTGHIPGGAVVRVAPDAYPGGVPSTKFSRDAAERNGFIHAGTGQADQPPGDAHGVARIKRVSLVATATISQPCAGVSGAARIKLLSLVATSASASHGLGESAATAEFRDIELEMIALLLAA